MVRVQYHARRGLAGPDEGPDLLGQDAEDGRDVAGRVDAGRNLGELAELPRPSLRLGLGPLPLAHVPEVESEPAIGDREDVDLEPPVESLEPGVDTGDGPVGHGTAVFSLEDGAEGLGEYLPEVLPDEFLSPHAVHPLGGGVHVSEPPSRIDGHEPLVDALED